MSLDATRRGRPKGSGLDDQKHLQKIADMIAAKPDLKPTTAIKALGITDPSIIRRLRDKFSEFSSAIAQPADTPAATITPRPAALSEPRVMAAKIAKPSVALKSAPAGAVQTASAATEPPVKAPPLVAVPVVTTSVTPFQTPADMFIAWYGLGLSAIQSAMSTQAALASSMVRFPHVELALRQQLVASEIAMALHPLRSVSRARLH